MLNRGIKTVTSRLGARQTRGGGDKADNSGNVITTQTDHHGVLPPDSLTFGPKLFTHDRQTAQQGEQRQESGIMESKLWDFCGIIGGVYIMWLMMRMNVGWGVD